MLGRIKSIDFGFSGNSKKKAVQQCTCQLYFIYGLQDIIVEMRNLVGEMITFF